MKNNLINHIDLLDQARNIRITHSIEEILSKDTDLNLK